MSEIGSLLDKSRILAANDLKTNVVEVPEWGGSIRLRGLTGAEKTWCDRIERDIQAGKTTNQSYAAAIISCGAIDEKGVSLFSQADAVQIARRSVDVVERLAMEILTLSGATFAAQQAAEKN